MLMDLAVVLLLISVNQGFHLGTSALLIPTFPDKYKYGLAAFAVVQA
jgi:hypothetical protein